MDLSISCNQWIILWDIIYLLTKGDKYKKINGSGLKFQKVFFSYVPLLCNFTFIVNCVSFLQVSPAQTWAASRIFELSGHQLDEPMGFFSDPEQQ